MGDKILKFFRPKNFFKKLIVILVLFGVSMTNIPYRVISEAIDSYVSARNIVDRAWHLSRNDNVVDNFAPGFHNKQIESLYKLASALKVPEASAAVTYVGGQSGSFAGKTTATTVTFALTGGVATTPAAGDLVVVAYSVGSTANRALTIQNTAVVDYTLAGTELYQNDTYDSNLRVAYRIMPATPETQMVLSGTGSTADAGAYTIHVFRGVDPTTPLDVAAVTAGGINTRVANPGPITPVSSGAWIYVAGAAAGATGGTYTAAYLTNFRAVTVADTNDAMVGAGYVTWTSGAYDPAAFAGGGTSTTNDSWTAVTLALRPMLADTTPPSPNPMTFASVPAAGGTSQIDMTASTATDAASPPVQYYFTLDQTGCPVADRGTGAADSGWQSATTYSDGGTLQTNKCYGYTVKARDSAATPNETALSSVFSAYTSAQTPSAPTISSPTDNTLTLDNNENGNPLTNPTTMFAVQVTTADANWNGMWVNATGNPSATAVWLTDAQLTGLVINGLQNTTNYSFQSKARNQDGLETALSTAGSGSTTAPNSPPTISISQPDGVGDTVTVGQAYNITYTLADTDNVVTAAFYYDTDNTGLNGTAISGACATAAEGTGLTCSWDTTGVTPGTYYVYGIVNDGVNPAVSAYSPGMITISPQITLTIAATAGSKVTNLNSGDTLQFVHSTSCTSESTCAAIKLSAANGAVTVTSIKVSEIGTAAANTDLSNLALIYDTDANYSNGTAGTFGTASAFAADQTVTFTNAGLTIPSGSSYYFYVRLDLKSGAPTYPAGGQTVNFSVAASADVGTTGSPVKSGTATLAGTTTIRPQITGYTNSTESGLNYAAACTTCGARIGPDSIGKAQTIVISGYGFGSDPGAGNRDTATNKVEVGTKLLTDNVGSSNVTAWSNTSVTLKTDTAIDTDASWGTNFGGAASLKVTAGGQAVPTSLNFYVFPQVSSLTVCNSANFPIGDNAREYDANDSACPNGLKDGEIILNGTRFGTALTGGYVRILGCDASTCTSPAGSAVTTAWTNTAITAQVPAVIANNVYTGSIVMQQGAGTSNKTHTYTSNGFRVLPRITTTTPGSASPNDAIAINGDHLCQSGTCPSSFSATNSVTFFNTQNSTVFTSWTDTAITTAVPSSAADGILFATSNNYTTNNLNFSVLSATPLDPTNLGQYSNSGLSSLIATGAAVSSTPVYFSGTMQAEVTGGTLYLQIEYKPVGTPFTCSTGACASAIESIGKTGPGPIDCGTPGNGCFVTSSPADGIYHWQARARHNKSGINYYSNWIAYGGNSELATDFQIDKFGAVITFPNGDTCAGSYGTSVNTNGATISWSLNEGATGQVEYSKNSDMSGSVKYPSTPVPQNTSFSVPLTNLDSNTMYYFRVKTVDLAGSVSYKPTTTPYCSFQTGSVSQPAKTTIFHIKGFNSVISSLATSSFSVDIPETSYAIKSAYIEITGISPNASTNNIDVGVNAETVRTYVIPGGDSSFKIIYPVRNLNISPGVNEFDISPSQTLNIASAKIIVTYAYTP